MYPDKFRGLNERRTAAGIGTMIGMAGIVSSSIIPPLLIKFGVPETFRGAAWAMIGIGFFLFLAMIPGTWENKETRDEFHRNLQDSTIAPQEPLLPTLKTILGDRIFVTKVVFFFGYQSAVTLLSASAPYVVNFVMNMESSALSILMGGMLGGALLSVPVWIRVSHRVNDNRKLSIFAGFAMTATFLPIAFVSNFYLFCACLFVFGIGLGAQWFVDPPTMGDVIDNAVVNTGVKQEAIYYGFQAFFIRFGHSFQAGVFALVHHMTGFVEGATSQEELFSLVQNPGLVLFGIRIHTALVPAVVVLITTLIFWKYYDLTPEKIAENRKKLEEMGHES
jgi:Na+/melibiose symporter-like transporter